MACQKRSARGPGQWQFCGGWIRYLSTGTLKHFQSKITAQAASSSEKSPLADGTRAGFPAPQTGIVSWPVISAQSFVEAEKPALVRMTAKACMKNKNRE